MDIQDEEIIHKKLIEFIFPQFGTNDIKLKVDANNFIATIARSLPAHKKRSLVNSAYDEVKSKCNEFSKSSSVSESKSTRSRSTVDKSAKQNSQSSVPISNNKLSGNYRRMECHYDTPIHGYYTLRVGADKKLHKSTIGEISWVFYRKSQQQFVKSDNHYISGYATGNYKFESLEAAQSACIRRRIGGVYGITFEPIPTSVAASAAQISPVVPVATSPAASVAPASVAPILHVVPPVSDPIGKWVLVERLLPDDTLPRLAQVLDKDPADVEQEEPYNLKYLLNADDNEETISEYVDALDANDPYVCPDDLSKPFIILCDAACKTYRKAHDNIINAYRERQSKQSFASDEEVDMLQCGYCNNEKLDCHVCARCHGVCCKGCAATNKLVNRRGEFRCQKCN